MKSDIRYIQELRISWNSNIEGQKTEDGKTKRMGKFTFAALHFNTICGIRIFTSTKSILSWVNIVQPHGISS